MCCNDTNNQRYIKLAEAIATSAHKGQLDKGGHPYIEHPRAVSKLVSSDDEKVVAWLHDVIEDTDITLEDLKLFGFSSSILEAVDAITRRPGEERSDYLMRVADNRLATAVKIADLTHNSDLSRIKCRPLTDKDYNRTARYKTEIKLLEGMLDGRK